MSVVAELRAGPLDPPTELAAISDAAATDGAIVSFVGMARPNSADGLALHSLVLDHHPRLTETSLQDIAAEAANRFDVNHVRVVHRCGRVAVGEAIVFAAAAARHRRAAFEAADYLMDRLKTEAVFWKREEGTDGSKWIEPTDSDYGDRRRWE